MGTLPSELKYLDIASTVDDNNNNLMTASVFNRKLEEVEADLLIDCEIKEGIGKDRGLWGTW